MAILDSAAIMPRTCVAADQVLVLDTVGSTNTYAADLVRAGRLFGMDGMDGIAGNLVWSGREIVVVAANEQTAGRGRLDHTWASVPGESFIVSLVVSVPVAIVRDSSVNGWLQMIAGCEMREAIVGAVCDFGGTLDEDVFAEMAERYFLRAARKLGGVLAEMVPIPDCGGSRCHCDRVGFESCRRSGAIADR